MKSFFGGVCGLVLPITGDEGLTAIGGEGFVSVFLELAVSEVSTVGLLGTSPPTAFVLGAASDALFCWLIGKVPLENPAGNPPTVKGCAIPPIGGDLIKPPILTWCLWPDGLFDVSAVGPFCLALLISDIQLGC
jgi:hypothetical protein